MQAYYINSAQYEIPAKAAFTSRTKTAALKHEHVLQSSNGRGITHTHYEALEIADCRTERFCAITGAYKLYYTTHVNSMKNER